jgi:hypothetical protein
MGRMPMPADQVAVVVAEEANGQKTQPPEEVMAALPFDADNTSEIYAAIARRYYTIDHTFGDKSPNWEGLYLVARTDDSVGDPDTQRAKPVDLPNEIISGVAQRLNDLPTKLMWVDKRESVQTNPENGTLDNGQSAMIVFGNIHKQNDGTVHVPASLYFSSLGATGKTYILSNENGYWEIIGTTGVEWIS